MLAIAQLTQDFSKLRINDLEHRHAVVSISSPPSIFNRILNTLEKLSVQPDASIVVDIRRLPNVCEYSLLEVFEPTMLDRCQQVTLSILLDSYGSAVIGEVAISRKKLIDMLLKAIFGNMHLNVRVSKELKAGFTISVPQDLLLLIRDFGELKNCRLLRSLTISEIIEVMVSWNPNPKGHCLIELRDPLSFDLEGCNRVFSRILLHHDSTSTLEDIVNSSIPAVKTIGIVKKIRELTGSKILFYSSDVTKIPCDINCNNFSLASFRAVQITGGGTWFEAAGAKTSTNIHRVYARSCADFEYIRAFELEGVFGSDSPIDYHRFVNHFTAFIEMALITSEAYIAARNFLTNLSLQEVQKFLCHLRFFDRVDEVMHALDDAIALVMKIGFKHPGTIKELLSYLTQVYQKDENSSNRLRAHQFIHHIRDCFAQHRSSIYLTIGTNKLIFGCSNHMKIAIATQVLSDIPLLDVSREIQEFNQRLESIQDESSPVFIELSEKLFFFSEYTTKNGASIVYDLLFCDSKMREMYLDMYENYNEKRINKPQFNTPLNKVKVFSHSTEQQRSKFLSYSIDRGAYNCMSALTLAVDWFGNLSLSQFNSINPAFFDHHKHKFPKPIMECLGIMQNFTIREFLKQVEEYSPSNAINILYSMLLSLKRPFSDAFVEILENYKASPESFKPEDWYVIWSLAKLTIEHPIPFGFE